MAVRKDDDYPKQTQRLLLNIEEVGEALSCSRSLVYTLIAAGELQPIKLGRAVRFRVSDVNALIERLARRPA